MSSIYLHYDDKTLVLDSSENLLYPLLGSLLKWDNLRIGIAVSLTQSMTDNNAGFYATESLPIVSGGPLLNRLSIGLKNRGTELPGEDGSVFAGISNATNSQGSSLGFYGSTIVLAPESTYNFDVKLAWTGANHIVSGSSLTIPLAVPFDNSGTAHVVSIGSPLNFHGNVVYLDSTLANSQNFVQVSAPSPVTITATQLTGYAPSDVVKPVISLGTTINNSRQYSSNLSVSTAFQYPASFVMQGSTNYASIVILDYIVTNRGLPSQAIKIGYQVIPNEGDTSPDNLEAKMGAYTPNFESSTLPFNTTMPTSFFIRWPFNTTRLRLHSLVVKKY